MTKKGFKEAEFRLSAGKKILKIIVVHNIPGEGNINSIEAAFDNWINRTDEYTSKSFAEYIKSKGLHLAYTKEEFDKL